MSTIEELVVRQMQSCLRTKNKTTGLFKDVRDPEDGHVLTKEEGIAMNLVNQALQGDIKAVEYCQRAKLICAQNQSKNKKK